MQGRTEMTDQRALRSERNILRMKIRVNEEHGAPTTNMRRRLAEVEALIDPAAEKAWQAEWAAYMGR